MVRSQEKIDALFHGQRPGEASCELSLRPDAELKPAVCLAGLEQHADADAAARDRFLHVIERVLTRHAQLFAQLAHREAADRARQSGNDPILKV